MNFTFSLFFANIRASDVKRKKQTQKEKEPKQNKKGQVRMKYKIISIHIRLHSLGNLNVLHAKNKGIGKINTRSKKQQN